MKKGGTVKVVAQAPAQGFGAIASDRAGRRQQPTQDARRSGAAVQRATITAAASEA